MPPTRSRPAPDGVATVPPSLFLITSERRRTWRPDQQHFPAATSIEIDLREPAVDGSDEAADSDAPV
ncbi:MAG: hypothetical protein HYX32_02430 [Actinobacteria bacterium]|nr:hypothetical protein [Actinomycetota bacterium]